MTTIPEKGPARPLHEFLKEKQEPFVLDVYILEKVGSKTGPHSDAEIRHSHANSCKKLAICSSKSRKHRGSRGFTSLKSTLTKLVYSKNLLNYTAKAFAHMRRKSRVAVLNRTFSRRSIMFFGCCSDYCKDKPSSSKKSCVFSPTVRRAQALKLHCNLKQKGPEDKMFEMESVEANKHLDSMLILPSNHLLPPMKNQKKLNPRKSKEESPSTSSHHVITKDVIEDYKLSVNEKHSLEFLLASAISSDFLKTKWVCQQTKQLLYDCVKEVMENHGNQARNKSVQVYSGPEITGKIICEQILSWSKQDGKLTNITTLIESDLQDNKQQWCHCNPPSVIKEMGSDLEDRIFENVIEEFVSEMISNKEQCILL